MKGVWKIFAKTLQRPRLALASQKYACQPLSSYHKDFWNEDSMREKKKSRRFQEDESGRIEKKKKRWHEPKQPEPLAVGALETNVSSITNSTLHHGTSPHSALPIVLMSLIESHQGL